jgi:hypothetical protein
MSKNTSTKKQNKKDFLESNVFSKNHKFSELADWIPITELYDDYEKEKTWEPFHSLPLSEQKKFEESFSNLENIIMKRNINTIESESTKFKLPFNHFHDEITIPYSKLINAYNIDYDNLSYKLLSKEKEMDYLYNLSSYNCFEEYILPKIRKKNDVEFILDNIKKELYEKCDDIKIISVDFDKITQKYLICARMDDLQDMMFLCIVALPFDSSSVNEYFQKNTRLCIAADNNTYQKILNTKMIFDFYFYFPCGCGK